MRTRSSFLVSLFFAASFCAVPVLAQSSAETGKLKINVEPKQAYVFVDGKAIRDGNQKIALSAGDHKVGVYNYGYLPNTQDVHIVAGQTTDLRVALQSSGDRVSGPFADIEFKGHPSAAVLLNGSTPAYFVGHVDEFDWDWIWHQRLLVKPGTYQVTITREGNTVWSGSIDAKAGQKVIVNLNHNGEMKTVEWKQGLNMSPQPRFHAGIASATVPVAPVTAQLSAQSNAVSCGEGTQLTWKSADAADATISGLGEVPGSGSRSVSPTRDTTYTLNAKGPGGEVTQSVKVDVNGTPVATLALSQPEVHYHKIGDRVVDQGSTRITWSTSNANSAVVEPFDSHAMSGSEEAKANPEQTATGPIDEYKTYTLTATNACGGTETKTVKLHVVGSIDPPPAVTLASLFFPTAYPTEHHATVGLLSDEKLVLDNLATQFKNFGLYEHAPSLVVIGYADVRGSQQYNRSLSERRAAVVRDYLISKGVPADEITIRVEGKDQQIDQTTVDSLRSKSNLNSDKWMDKDEKTTWLAYNRRVDLVLEPTDQKSEKVYPNDQPDARIAWQRHAPSLKKVEKDSGDSATMAKANVGGGN
jgi:outer membrane protein OmpA-like peptidoglycan-associated protein